MLPSLELSPWTPRLYTKKNKRDITQDILSLGTAVEREREIETRQKEEETPPLMMIMQSLKKPFLSNPLLAAARQKQIPGYSLRCDVSCSSMSASLWGDSPVMSTTEVLD
jgi:hypothetical protein